MIRRLKSEVLSQLPAIRRQIIRLPRPAPQDWPAAWRQQGHRASSADEEEEEEEEEEGEEEAGAVQEGPDPEEERDGSKGSEAKALTRQEGDRARAVGFARPRT